MATKTLWQKYFQRTGQVVGKAVSDIILMKGVDGPVRTPRTLFSFNTQDDVNDIATGCDGDIGGLSTAHFELDRRPGVLEGLGKDAVAVFHGDMKLQVKPQYRGKIRGGYAGFRNKTRPTMFGNLTEDISGHDYLAVRVRVAGDPRTHSSYFLNIQTEGTISTDLWQHRLFFRNANKWENIYIPFDSFVRTNAGEMSEHQIEMFRERVKSIGISLLGGNSGVEGKYELGIDSIRAVNEEEVNKDEDLFDEEQDFKPNAVKAV